MTKTIKRLYFFVVLAILGIGLNTGCRKKADTIAIINVRNIANEAVANSRVVLYGQSTTGMGNVVLYDTTYTDASGAATFNFNETYQLGQAGVAVLNIEAMKDGKKGQGIIKIEQETTSTETVYIQP